MKSLFFLSAFLLSFLSISQNSAPTNILIDGEEGFTIDENTMGYILGNLSTTDEDTDDDHVYTFVSGNGDDDNASFIISDGEVQVNQNLDYETKTSYSFRLQTDDQNGGLFEKSFSVILNDLNEAPTADNQNFSINEDSPPGLTSIMIVASDPEEDAITFSLDPFIEDDNTYFDVNSDGTIQQVSELDFSEKQLHRLGIIISDGELSSSLSIDIEIININDSPTDILLNNNSIEENTQIDLSIGSFTTEDKDPDDQFSYAIVDGEGDDDNNSFSILGDELFSNEEFDFETKSAYSIRVQTTDPGNEVYSKNFFINVIDVNEAPIANNQSFSIAENVSIGLTSFFIEASDPDGDELTYSAGVIIDEDNAFDVSSEGELILNSELNASEKEQHFLEIDVFDDLNITIVTVEITIENINDVPTNIEISDTNVNENSEIGTQVGSLETVDRDSQDAHIYALVEGDGDDDNQSFILSGNALLSNEVFDFETKSTYSVRIQSDDQNGGVLEEVFEINITNVNDLVVTGQVTQPVCSSDETGAIAIEISEFIEPLSFEWSNGETVQDLENISIGSYSLTVTDGTNMSVTQSFDVTTVPVYNQTAVCYISALDTSNLIYVNKGSSPFNVSSYLLYREGTSAGVYDFVGEMSSEEDFFVDSLINNKSRSFSYAVSMKDQCGNETVLSNEHSTIHLSVNKGQNDEVNLIWTAYNGLEVSTYSIYRNIDGGNYELLDQISSNNNSYTDFTTSLESTYFYYVSISVDDACNTDQNRIEDTIQARSNTIVVENEVLGLSNKSILVYPNPVSNFLHIQGLENDQTIQIISTDGKTVLQIELDANNHEIDLSTLRGGIYHINILSSKSIVKQVKIHKN